MEAAQGRTRRWAIPESCPHKLRGSSPRSSAHSPPGAASPGSPDSRARRRGPGLVCAGGGARCAGLRVRGQSPASLCPADGAAWRAPLPARPRVSHQTLAPARWQTTFLSCHFSRLSVELLVSERKQRRGAKAARRGWGRRGAGRDAVGGSRGAPRAGGAGGALCARPRSRSTPPAAAPPGRIPSPPFSPSHCLPSTLGPPFLPLVLQLPQGSLPWLCLKKKKKSE